MANIRQSHRQVAPQNHQKQQRQLKKNRINSQLLKMLCIQVLTILLTILPFIVYRLRASFTSNYIKSQYEVAQDNFFLQVATVISLISHSISFYLFTLSSTIFRCELFLILSKCSHISLNVTQNGLIMTNNTGNHQSNLTHQMHFVQTNQSIQLIQQH